MDRALRSRRMLAAQSVLSTKNVPSSSAPLQNQTIPPSPDVTPSSTPPRPPPPPPLNVEQGPSSSRPQPLQIPTQRSFREEKPGGMDFMAAVAMLSPTHVGTMTRDLILKTSASRRYLQGTRARSSSTTSRAKRQEETFNSIVQMPVCPLVAAAKATRKRVCRRPGRTRRWPPRSWPASRPQASTPRRLWRQGRPAQRGSRGPTSRPAAAGTNSRSLRAR